MRRDLPLLIQNLKKLEDLKDLTLTTNGALLADLAAPLYDAGLSRITVSLDSLDEDIFREMTDSTVMCKRFLKGSKKHKKWD